MVKQGGEWREGGVGVVAGRPQHGRVRQVVNPLATHFEMALDRLD